MGNVNSLSDRCVAALSRTSCLASLCLYSPDVYCVNMNREQMVSKLIQAAPRAPLSSAALAPRDDRKADNNADYSYSYSYSDSDTGTVATLVDETHPSKSDRRGGGSRGRVNSIASTAASSADVGEEQKAVLAIKSWTPPSEFPSDVAEAIGAATTSIAPGETMKAAIYCTP